MRKLSAGGWCPDGTSLNPCADGRRGETCHIERKRAGWQCQEAGVGALASVGQVRHQYHAKAR